MTATALAPLLTPHGRLVLVPDDDAPALDAALADRLAAAFARGSGAGLLLLGAGEVGTVLSPALAYWRAFGARYVTALCALPDAADRTGDVHVPAPSDEELAPLADAAPPMTGAEYVTPAALATLWEALDAALADALAASGGTVQELLRRFHPAWNLVGRVHVHLAENRKDAETPFAFLATYTTRLGAGARAQHVPLGQALREYSGAADRERLLALLLPLQRASERCPWLAAMVASGEVFHPLRWTPREALQLLRDVPSLESAGVVVRVPATWRAGRPPRPRVTATVGGAAPSKLGKDALLDFSVGVALDGEPLTDAEVETLLAASDGLALLRGQWVEVDATRLRRTLARFEEAERAAADEGLPFADALRLLAGADAATDTAVQRGEAEWAEVLAGPWLREALAGLRRPEGLADVDPGPGLHATLRPYQRVGVRWLHLLARLGLGACLADDMGLGKTIQVLALLEALRERPLGGQRGPSLLVAPASLLANWAAELARFTPGLRALVAHPSVLSAAELKALAPAQLADVDLVITSYATLLRVPGLAETAWALVVLDEAQAVKNPGAQQTRAVKKLRARARFALTGTPVENRLGDLWSIFDFLNPGLLGSAREFADLTKRLGTRTVNPYAPLRELVRPYILRRLKTDRTVIADLPDKTEMTAFCQLSRKQVALYEQAVGELAAALEGADGIQRRGVVLAFLTRLKQTCNHPSQWLGDGGWDAADSGKWARLREIAEVAAARQEKMLVFSQFREVTAPLAAFLGTVFGRPGLVLHGDTPVAKRAALVRTFQEDEAVPFFVLSLKAGGTGLNLTAASHVVHFDRWWNPAVEDQATDRAFRIGQTRNVLVHKFVCRGTVEERIDALIAAKRQVAREVLEGGAELLLTEMDDDALLRLVALDWKAALQEG